MHNRRLVDLLLRLEQSKSLDPAVEALAPLLGAVSHGPARALLQGDAAAHALHPAIVALPLGAWTSATVLDLAGGDAKSARLLVGVGILATGPAVATGLAELASARRSEQRIGVVHAAGNSAALALQVLSWGARRGGAHRAGAGLSLAAMVLASVAGYLGGHLSVARKLGSRDPRFAMD